MIQLQGFWYNGEGSARTDATLWLDENGELKIYGDADKQLLHRAHFADLSVSSRLGNTPRYIGFSTGQKFETPNNDAVDSMMAEFDEGWLSSVIHKLESHFHFVLLTLLLVIAFGWGMVTYGVPVASKLVAHALPHKVLEFATEQTLYTLDKSLFEETQLAAEEKQRVRDHFQSAVNQHPHLSLKLEFRDGGPIGANAFALPDGTIIFTDQMIRLARHDDELLAVFAHEIGHVEHRHGMRSVVQNSLLAFLLLMMTGDTSATAEIFLALPIILTELAYSRNFERESDDYALQYLRDNNIPAHYFPSLMQRLEKQGPCYSKVAREVVQRFESEDEVVVHSADAVDEEASQNLLDQAVKQAQAEQCSPKALDAMPEEKKSEEDFNFSNYLSTHPSTAERLQRFY